MLKKNLIVCSGISEAETTNNKRLHLTFCIEAIQTRSIMRPLCYSRASCWGNCPATLLRYSVMEVYYLSPGKLGRVELSNLL